MYVSWANWIPSYVRSEYKKRTGVAVDELGRVVNTKQNEFVEDSNDPNSKILNNGQENPNDKPKKIYTSVDQYQPTGKLVYNPDIFEKIEKKVL